MTCILKVPEFHSKGLFELHSRGTCDSHYRDMFDLYCRCTAELYCRGTAELYSRSVGSLIFLIHVVCRFLSLYQFPVSQGSHILV